LFGDLPNEPQAMLPDHPAMLRIFIGDELGVAQRQCHFFIRSFSSSHMA
jgi:hypothetical protein